MTTNAFREIVSERHNLPHFGLRELKHDFSLDEIILGAISDHYYCGENEKKLPDGEFKRRLFATTIVTVFDSAVDRGIFTQGNPQILLVIDNSTQNLLDGEVLGSYHYGQDQTFPIKRKVKRDDSLIHMKMPIPHFDLYRGMTPEKDLVEYLTEEMIKDIYGELKNFRTTN